MKKYTFLIWAFAQIPLAFAQNRIQFNVIDADEKAPLIGATIRLKDTQIGGIANASGVIELKDIPNGKYTALISFVGYESAEKSLVFPEMNGKTFVLALEHEHEEEHEEVIISSTRTSRTIESVPTRVETIGAEEIDEKMNMRPTNVSMILHESTGIQVQQTSATSASQSIRIQGLPGRYTQILKDGFPSFGGFSNSMSVLDIPPLDLQQVEVIKGSASTLYGGDAITGIVNFISKEPTDRTTVSAILNATSAKGFDANAYISGAASEKVRYSMLATFNTQEAHDVDHDDFSELPEAQIITLSPKLYFKFSEKTNAKIGHSFTTQNRLGGDMTRIKSGKNGIHAYSEENDSSRNLTTLQIDHKLAEGQKLVFKQSGSVFSRALYIDDASAFKGLQTHFYTDASYLNQKDGSDWVMGLNFVRDQLDERASYSTNPNRNSLNRTIGLYAQNLRDFSEKWALETGLRIDQTEHWGTFVLPRFSVLWKSPDKSMASRLTFGRGYKTPTIFTEEAETMAYQNVLPIDENTKAETSLGGTYDINFKTVIADEITFSINQMFFYTQINDPLVLKPSSNAFAFQNQTKPVVSKGMETNVKFSYEMLKAFAGYTLTNAKAQYLSSNQFLTLVPKHKLNLMLLAEEHRNYKAGIEGYFTGKQWLSDGTQSPQFWEFGLFLEKTFGKFSVFFNAENFTDTRQSRFEQVVLPPHQAPQFREIFTHTEGRTFNGGIKLNW